ncbi:uncharacterized protein LOC105183070 isoform X2 [Harpegnathos saltator]|nr:uncharacterized protein LOC105183070 isoform X2 [Harpegnathos saltator]
MKKTKQTVRTSTNNLHNKPTMSAKSLQTQNRKSFILPPNSIKNVHVAQNRFKHSKSMFPHINQTRILTEKSVTKYPRISEGSENCSPFVEDTDAPVNNSVAHEKNNKTSVIQHTSSQTFKTKNLSGISNLHSFSSNSTNANDNATENKTSTSSTINKALNVNICSNQNSCSCNVTDDKSQVLSMYNTDTRNNAKLYSDGYLNLETNAVYTPGVEKIKIEDMYVPLQAVKKISESYVDLQRDIDGCEYVTLSKKELVALTFNLKHLICKLEENISYLKLTSSNIVNLLSANATSKVTEENKVESKKQMLDSLDDNTKVVNNTSTVSLPCMTINVCSEVDHRSEGTSKILDSDALVCGETDVPKTTEDAHVKTQLPQQINVVLEDNKENKEDTNSSVKHSKPQQDGTRRRSARLLAKALKNSNVDNDSFVNLEHELNISSKPSVTLIMPHIDRTPVMTGCKDKKTERPWKEYMALKSRMSCLLTPNIKRFNSVESKDNMHPETGGIRTSLSSKIFADLHNLYADSPDPQ